MRHLIALFVSLAAISAEAAPLRPVAIERPQWFSHRFNSGLDRAFSGVIGSRGAWEDLWSDLEARSGPPRAAPEIDFRRTMLLVAALGQRPTGGFAIRITSVRRDRGALVATVIRTSPGRRCGTTQALTEPVDIVLVPRTTMPVRWRYRDEVTRC